MWAWKFEKGNNIGGREEGSEREGFVSSFKHDPSGKLKEDVRNG